MRHDRQETGSPGNRGRVNIKSLSEYEFRKFRVRFHGPIGALIATEKEWYETSDRSVLGIVLLDRTDRDWGFVVLSPDEKGDFRAVNTGHSFKVIGSARDALFTAMEEQSPE